MASIGRAEYPELIPSDAFDIAEKMGKGSVKTANGLASVMGLGSTDSGYFYHRVAALTKYYGVVDRSKLSVS
ncbi:MAG TPA: hypothetical protein VGU43_01565, partial [Thermoplasmata archaeon]|nr:hypothetical protein [Thermoplasmata archaeon]